MLGEPWKRWGRFPVERGTRRINYMYMWVRSWCVGFSIRGGVCRLNASELPWHTGGFNTGASHQISSPRHIIKAQTRRRDSLSHLHKFAWGVMDGIAVHAMLADD